MVCIVLRIEPRALCMLGESSTTEVYTSLAKVLKKKFETEFYVVPISLKLTM